MKDFVLEISIFSVINIFLLMQIKLFKQKDLNPSLLDPGRMQVGGLNFILV